MTRPRLLLADPTPSKAPLTTPNYFEVEVRLFQAGVNLASKSGIMWSAFPLVAPQPPIVFDENEADEEPELAAPS